MAVMNWQYIAGFFDGEGCVRIHQGGRNLSPQLSLHQSRDRGRSLLEEIRLFLAENGIKSNLQKHRDYVTERNGIQSMYRLYIYNNQGALEFIKGVFPYIRIKKVECQDIWRWLIMYPSINSSMFKRYPPERAMCSNGHALTSGNVYLQKQRGNVRTPMWKACRRCRLNERKHNWETIIKPIMIAYGVRGRDVNSDMIARARREGIIA